MANLVPDLPFTWANRWNRKSKVSSKLILPFKTTAAPLWGAAVVFSEL